MTVRFRDPAGSAARVVAFEHVVKTSARLVDGLARTTPASDAERLREALEIVNVQHEELLSAEEELREQVDELSRALGNVQVERERFRELFEAAPDAYFVTDADGVIRDANARACEMLGISALHIRRKPLPLYVGATDDARAMRTWLANHASGDSLELAVDLVGRHRAPVRVELRAVRIDKGRRVLVLARSLAKRVEAGPDDKRALADALELLARERTRREELERETRAKDRLLRVLSNDLRTPLNAVLGWTDLLRRELLDRGRRDHALATIDGNARSVLAVLEELLDISRSDHVQLAVTPVELSGLVRNVVNASGAVAKERGVSVTCSADGPVVVLGDRSRLTRAVSCLVSRALAKSPAGGTVEISVAFSGSDACVCVRDDGGIAAEDLPHVFDCYPPRADATSRMPTAVSELFVVRQVAAIHGGSVDAASDGVGTGATLRMLVPSLRPVTAVPPPPASAPMLAPLSGMRVLVVDDDEDSRELLNALLTDAGAHVGMAADAADAIAMIATWHPDVIVSDVSLRGDADGLEVARAARRELGVDVVAIAVSGFTSERDAERSIDAGFDAHLAKPLSPGELVAAIAHAANLRGL